MELHAKLVQSLTVNNVQLILIRVLDVTLEVLRSIMYALALIPIVLLVLLIKIHVQAAIMDLD